MTKYTIKNVKLNTIKYSKENQTNKQEDLTILKAEIGENSCRSATELGHWNLNPFLKLGGLCLILSFVFWSGISMIFTVILNYCKLEGTQMEKNIPFASFLSL